MRITPRPEVLIRRGLGRQSTHSVVRQPGTSSDVTQKRRPGPVTTGDADDKASRRVGTGAGAPAATRAAVVPAGRTPAGKTSAPPIRKSTAQMEASAVLRLHRFPRCGRQTRHSHAIACLLPAGKVRAALFEKDLDFTLTDEYHLKVDFLPGAFGEVFAWVCRRSRIQAGSSRGRRHRLSPQGRGFVTRAGPSDLHAYLD
jgi:hypothetical protein